MKRPRRLFAYYRQFEQLSPEEISRGYKERSEEARSRALAIIPALDLSSAAWHEPPHPDVVNAATFALRRAVNAYPDPSAGAARAAIAERHDLRADGIVLGHGAGELLGAALTALLADGGEVVLPWPTWTPVPILVARAGGTPVPVPLIGDGVDLAGIDAAVREETRAVVLAGPNDPTGVPLDVGALRALLDALPERVVVIVDEALGDFLEDPATALPLLEGAPNLLVVRSFAKLHAMAGFRVGWAAGGTGLEELLAGLAPTGSIGATAQAAAVAAMEVADLVLPRRRAAAAADRARLAAALSGSRVTFPAGAAANTAWLSAEGHDSRSLAAHLLADGMTVTPGVSYGDEQHVRATLRGPVAVDRLAEALTRLG